MLLKFLDEPLNVYQKGGLYMTEFERFMPEDAFDSILASFPGLYLFFFIILIFAIVSYWKIFNKAGQHGWASLIPVYRNYLLFKIAFGSGWLSLLLFVPFVNAVMAVLLPFKLAKSFGKGMGYGFGLLFFSCVFYPMLAFGQAKYIGAEH